MGRRPVAGTITAGWMSLAAACSPGTDRGPQVTMRDSAGVSIAENPTPDDSLANVWWRLDEPELDIGGFDAVEPYALYRVSDALRRTDGSIVVANAGTSEVRFFDAEGSHLRTTGGEGDGPGEFRSLGGLERGEADTLLAFDSRARWISVLSPEGAFVRSIALEGAALIPRIEGRLASGRFLSISAGIGDLSGRQDGTEVTRNDVALLMLAADGRSTDTLLTTPGPERVFKVMQSSGQIMSISLTTPPFGRTPTYALFGDEVYVAPQDAAEIRVFGEDGALRRIVRTGREPEPITEAHLAAYEEDRIQRLPEERRAEARASGQFGDIPHGDFVPPYARVTTDLTGNLWVADYADPTDPPNRWTVYDPTGGVLARISLPERLTPYDIGDDWILGRELDDLDVDHVRLYRIVKG